MAGLSDKLKTKDITEKLYANWLRSRSQPAPDGFVDINDLSSEPYNAYMKPSDMHKYVRAFSPSELYKYEDQPQIPIPLDYPTVAFNYRNITDLGKPQANLIASEKGSPIETTGYTVDEIAQHNIVGGMPERVSKLTPAGILAHEQGHYDDPRIDRQPGNLGYLQFMGMRGDIANRELPAMIAEAEFWQNQGKESNEVENLKNALRKLQGK